MPNNRKLRDLLLSEKYNRHYKKELKRGVPKVRKRKRMTFKQYFSYLESLPYNQIFYGIPSERFLSNMPYMRRKNYDNY